MSGVTHTQTHTHTHTPEPHYSASSMAVESEWLVVSEDTGLCGHLTLVCPCIPPCHQGADKGVTFRPGVVPAYLCLGLFVDEVFHILRSEHI